MLRITAAALLAIVATLAGPVPARAGGFATTVLDPLPAKFEPGAAYTIGFWVLQHGSHPYPGKDLEVALVLTDDKGAATTYPAAALPEPAHYAAAVVFGRAGKWRLASRQGFFGDYALGAATVPGGFKVEPGDAPYTGIQIDYKYWDAIRPPQPEQPRPAVAAVPVAAEQAGPPPPRGGSWGAAAIGGGVLLAAAGALYLSRRNRLPSRLRRGRGASTP
jgi:hypothetical protein